MMLNQSYMKFSRLLPLLVFVLSTLSVFAQKPKPADFGIKSKKALNFYFEGRQQEQWRARAEAIKAYEAALEIEPDFAHAHYRLGVNAYVSKRDEEALEHLEAAFQLNAAEFANIGFYLGEAYFRNERYAEAVPKLEAFLQQQRTRKVDREQAQESLKHARFAAAAIQAPVNFEPLNMGEAINTDRDEYLPHLTADDQFLLFTSKRPESVGGFNRALKDYSEDFYYSEFANGEWSPVKNLGLPINTPGNEGSAAITQDGRTIYFTACNRPDGQGSCDIYVSHREGDKWSEAENLGPRVNSEGWESQPCLSPDGKRLYFASSRVGGMGGRDIWYVERIDDKYWSMPVNLGSPVNTKGNEYSPFVHADGQTLYFSSNYHPGFGSQDLFVSYAQPGDKWADPINLGYPLNTKADESNIFVSANGRTGFINSYRDGGLGQSDLYQFVLDERIRPEIATFLRGITIDSLTRAPVQARLRLVDVETGDTLRDMQTGRSDGKFLMSLPLEREYAAFVSAPGYLFVSQNFYLKDLDEETYFDITIPMMKVKKGVPVVLKNIFFETGKYELKETSTAELGFLVYFLQQNPSVRIEIGGHTDDVGTDTDNQNLSQRRADAVKAYLAQQGIEASRIKAIGYGESRPVASNDTDAGKAKNRRTEFVIVD